MSHKCALSKMSIRLGDQNCICLRRMQVGELRHHQPRGTYSQYSHLWRGAD